MLFFKATAPETVHESALTEKLASWFPNCLPELLAVDPGRGWILMRDGGEQLRLSIRPTQDIKPWERAISRYAELQIGLIEHIAEILALGIPDHRLKTLPALYAGLLSEEGSLLIDQPRGLSAAQVQDLRGLIPRFGQICSELAAFGIPESLDHGDFHDGNILVRDGRITFFDWGDASVTHPFVSLRTLFVSIEIALKLDDYSFTPAMAALLDLYLRPWQKFAPQQALVAAYRLSKPVASVVKALAWHTTISRLPEGSPLHQEYAWIVPEVFKEFLVYAKALSSHSD